VDAAGSGDPDAGATGGDVGACGGTPGVTSGSVAGGGVGRLVPARPRRDSRTCTGSIACNVASGALWLFAAATSGRPLPSSLAIACSGNCVRNLAAASRIAARVAESSGLLLLMLLERLLP